MKSDFNLKPLPPHLGLLAIGSYIKQHGYSPIIFDSRKYFQEKKDYWPDLDILLKDAVCVGISVMTAQAESGVMLSKRIKDHYPNLPIVWGGYHPSLFPLQTLEDPLVDFIIQGEGDWSFLDLLKAFETNGPYDKIDGLGFKKDGVAVFNPQAKFFDFNELPAWDWSLYDVTPFLVGGTWSDPTPVRQLPVQNSRGCPYQCTFCINTILGCYRKWRPKSVKKVVDEVEGLVKNYNIEWISFRDEIFFLTKERIVSFCDELINRNIKIKWSAQARANFFTAKIIDDEVLRKLKLAGCVNLGFGAESGSPRILRFLKKAVTPEEIVFSAKKCEEYGLKPYYSFIVGLPGETEKDLMMTYDVMKKILEACPCSVLIGPHLYRPYPGCELYEMAKKMGGAPEAKSLREWPILLNQHFNESSDPIERDGYGFDSLPWIYDTTFLKAFIAYSRYAVYNPFYLFKTKRYFMGIMSIIAKARFSMRFYAFTGIERKLKNIFF
jgi:anaerobic magnesium-protoporphyrin IX monomethyl ester cyclase